MVLHSLTGTELESLNALINCFNSFRWREVSISPYKDRVRFREGISIDGFTEEDISMYESIGLSNIQTMAEVIVYLMNCSLDKLPLLVNSKDVEYRSLIEFRLKVGK